MIREQISGDRTCTLVHMRREPQLFLLDSAIIARDIEVPRPNCLCILV